ncbi:metal-dependent hydrolase [Modestobacter italicus]|uniref:metal-dependent hydrolase n=1 Tax=Modestobacter italicus (strain DSM 44449 / CECT 9708 / BC 501) TaxID=2732864 RepID=UPI001C973904|nr:metal-dependent hydrolase [Modestobacter italicus]
MGGRHRSSALGEGAVPRRPGSSSAWVPSAVLVLTALLLVPVLDRVRTEWAWPTVVVGALDEPAHLLTAVLLVGALSRWLSGRVVGWALVGSVALDLDHLPLYLGWEAIASPGGRPVTHSLATVLLLVAAASLPALRSAGLGLALGIGTHLVRDLATGPGVPLGWPASAQSLTMPYPLYLLVLVGAALVALHAGQRPDQVSDPAPGDGPAADGGTGRSRTARSRTQDGSAGAPAGHGHTHTSSPQQPARDQSPRRSTGPASDAPAGA